MIVLQVLALPGWHDVSWCHSAMGCCDFFGATVSLWLQINLTVAVPPPREDLIWCKGQMRAFCKRSMSCCCHSQKIQKPIGNVGLHSNSIGLKASARFLHFGASFANGLHSDSTGGFEESPLRASATMFVTPFMHWSLALHSSIGRCQCMMWGVLNTSWVRFL